MGLTLFDPLDAAAAARNRAQRAMVQGLFSAHGLSRSGTRQGRADDWSKLRERLEAAGFVVALAPCGPRGGSRWVVIGRERVA